MASEGYTLYPSSDVEAKYKEVASIPVLEGGWLRPSSPTQVMLVHSQRDLVRNARKKIARMYFEQVREEDVEQPSHLPGFTVTPFAMQMNGVVAIEPSPSWDTLCLLRSTKEKGDEAETYNLEIWDEGGLIHSLVTDGKHEQVYTDGKSF